MTDWDTSSSVLSARIIPTRWGWLAGFLYYTGHRDQEFRPWHVHRSAPFYHKEWVPAKASAHSSRIEAISYLSVKGCSTFSTTTLKLGFTCFHKGSVQEVALQTPPFHKSYLGSAYLSKKAVRRSSSSFLTEVLEEGEPESCLPRQTRKSIVAESERSYPELISHH